ncbi:S24 family peptidase [Devosia beringensis]|uniref:S24 family peptidase n=1 Tax=Devosia beringensis TaxID=2657486 RepID=UPI00186B8113|nr:LexA family transcriptional regulator [Devosia beringensis]
MSDDTKAYVRHVMQVTGLSATALAKKAGMPSTTLTRPLNDPEHKFSLSNSTIEKIASATRITLASFLSQKGGVRELDRVPLDEDWRPTSDSDGEGYDRDSYSPRIPGAIPELDARAGAGEGSVGEVMVLPVGNGTISAHKILDEWRIPPAYLREAVANPDRAIVLGIQGDSMMPNYAPGDRVIIDLTEHELRADGVYLISDGYSEPQIKRLQRIMFAVPPRCKIISDNPSYDSQEVDVDGVKILGKVAAYVGRR